MVSSVGCLSASRQYETDSPQRERALFASVADTALALAYQAHLQTSASTQQGRQHLIGDNIKDKDDHKSKTVKSGSKTRKF